ncbi:glycosyltransferase family 2 protein [Bacteroides sp.]
MDAVIQAIEPVLYLCFCLTTIYLIVFAIAALFKRTDIYPPARKKLRYVVLLPENSELTPQQYPEALYSIIHYSNLYDAIKALDDTQYDMAVILGETSHAPSDLLDEINNAHEAGATAIQLHHIITPRNSRKLRRKATCEEIRNSFFKQGQIRFGLSSALDGTDMAFEIPWLKKNQRNPDSNLEKRLARQNIYVEYLEYCHIESNSPRTPRYHVKRARALAAIPEAITTANWDYLNKTIQWLLPSWKTQLISITILATLMTAYKWVDSLKWWGLLFILIFTICLAIPDYLLEKSPKKKN